MASEMGSKLLRKQGAATAGTAALGDKNLEKGPGGIRQAGGSLFKPLNSVLVNQALQTLWLGPNPAKDRRDGLNSAALAALIEFDPKDGIEGMMAAQAVGLHSAAMECLRRAMIPDQPGEAADKLRKQAANMTRTFLDVLSALDRKRGKGGQQVVRVERVMIGPGGQAVVGNVTTGAAGGMGQHGGGVGRETGTGGEPHAPPAQLAHDATFGPILPRCRAQTRAGTPCRSPAMPNGRCRMHGGLSTGPSTAAGLERVRAARTVHGLHGTEMREMRRLCAELWADAKCMTEEL